MLLPSYYTTYLTVTVAMKLFEHHKNERRRVLLRTRHLPGEFTAGDVANSVKKVLVRRLSVPECLKYNSRAKFETLFCQFLNAVFVLIQL